MNSFQLPAQIVSKYAIVLYHANCTDGFGAAYIFNDIVGQDYENIDYIPVEYGDIPGETFTLVSYPPNVPLDIFILDFSFPKHILHELCKFANHVTLLDHHKTALEDLEDWIADPAKRPANLTLVFDMRRSGAGITYDYFAEKKGLTGRPELINYIEDADLWKFALQNSKAISASIKLVPRNLQAYMELESDMIADLRGVVQRGEVLLEQHLKMCEEIITEARKATFVGTNDTIHEGLVVNCTPQFASAVGNMLAKESGTFGGTYHILASGDTQVSLRSIGDFDVSEIAKMFGGGGHRNAAGFTLYTTKEQSDNGFQIFTLAPEKAL